MAAKTYFVSGPSGCRYIKGLTETTQAMIDLAIKEMMQESDDDEQEFTVTEVEPQLPEEVGHRAVCAANLYKGRIILGIRHFDGIMHAQYRGNSRREETMQGFLDNKGRFLSREEAWKVAMSAGQIIRRVGGDEGCLYSENIY